MAAIMWLKTLGYPQILKIHILESSRDTIVKLLSVTALANTNVGCKFQIGELYCQHCHHVAAKIVIFGVENFLGQLWAKTMRPLNAPDLSNSHFQSKPMYIVYVNIMNLCLTILSSSAKYGLHNSRKILSDKATYDKSYLTYPFTISHMLKMMLYSNAECCAKFTVKISWELLYKWLR